MFLNDIHLAHKLCIHAVIFPQHVEGKRLDKTVWSLLTFHAYVSYHVKVLTFFSWFGVSFISILWFTPAGSLDQLSSSDFTQFI
jgi:hypothetical protein